MSNHLPEEPFELEVGKARLPEAPEPAEAPPLAAPEGAPRAADSAAAAALERAAGRGDADGEGPGLFGRLVWWALGGLVALGIGLGVESLVSGLFARAAALGWVGIALLTVVGLALAGLALREVAGIARLRRVDGLKRAATAALADGAAEGAAADEPGRVDAANEALDGLVRLYAARGDMAEGLESLERARGDIPSPMARLGFAERRLMAPLDRRANRAAERAARQVAAATAIVPMPLLDILMVLVLNLRMLREVAAIYGGRAGWLGSVRLLRAVAGHLLATGAVSATDDLVAPMLGQGIVGRLSRRVGEAALNAALTARVGAAAIEVCRPLPFVETERPKARRLLFSAIGDWRGRNGEALPERTGPA